MTAVPLKLQRSFMYVPPVMTPLLAASRDAATDVICFDLEDGTPPDRKDEARNIIRAFLAEGRTSALETVVRINGLDTQWGLADLQFVQDLGVGVDGVLLPKVEDVSIVQRVKAQVGALSVWCLLETPLGILRAEEIAQAGIAGIVVGGVDLAEGLGARIGWRPALVQALGHLVLVARAYGVPVIDTMYLDYGDMDGLALACSEAADFGFHGKSVFSAETAAIANRAFRPSTEAVSRAQAALGGTAGYGAHIDQARQVLRLAALADERDGSGSL